MKVILREGNVLIIRLDGGEDVIFALQKFCREKKVEAGYFSAIGAASRAVISWYDIAAKKYFDKEVDAALEIISLQGNVAMMGSDVIIHAHGCFSDKNFVSYAGHVKQCVVGATCEIVLTQLVHPMERMHDEATGLNLLK